MQQGIKVSGAKSVLFLAGQVAYDKDRGVGHRGDFKSQAHEVFRALKALVEAPGGTLASIVKLNTYVTDIRRGSRSRARGILRQEGAGVDPRASRRPRPSDPAVEAKLRRWICACEEMQKYKYCHCLLFVTEEGTPVTEYLPADHEGREAYGVVKDPNPDKGRATAKVLEKQGRAVEEAPDR